MRTTTRLGWIIACSTVASACGDDGSANDEAGDESGSGEDTGEDDGTGDDDDGETGDESADESGDDEDSGDETGDDCQPGDANVPDLDESSCAPGPNDYTPTVNGSADDVWPTCANDDGTYHPLGEPSAAARVEAYAMMRSIFAAGLTPEDFTAAREQYALAEGIESRVLRREDVHYPNIPEDEQDPTVDFDKQCTIEANVTSHPDRCAGPAKIAPIINEAFAAGQTGEGDPAVHAARIDAAVAWFMYLSVLKEATFSCPAAGFSDDCDAAWGYYNGATDRAEPLGLGADVLAASALANERIFDGISAMRCFRDGYGEEEEADITSDLYTWGSEQLDTANNYGAAVVLRERIVNQPMLCGSEADANWAWVQVFGQALIKPAQDTDAAQATAFEGLLAKDAPTIADIQAGVATLDALFPCP